VKKLLFAIAVMALCTLSFAQKQGASRVANGVARFGSTSPDGSSRCAFTFTSGAKITFLKYCVTANGNVTQFESPQGHEHIAVFDVAEGYAMCDETDSNDNVAYFDYGDGGDSRNWGPASVLSQTAKSLKIARSTSDGAWTLTQTFNMVGGPAPTVQISMVLRNNTVVDRSVLLLRAVDVDADGQVDNNLGSTVTSAFAWNSVNSSHPYGLTLESLGVFSSVQIGFALDNPNPPNPCGLEVIPGTFTNTDGTIAMAYGLNIPANSSKTVSMDYRAF
jgi:hypothetical protein